MSQTDLKTKLLTANDVYERTEKHVKILSSIDAKILKASDEGRYSILYTDNICRINKQKIIDSLTSRGFTVINNNMEPGIKISWERADFQQRCSYVSGYEIFINT